MRSNPVRQLLAGLEFGSHGIARIARSSGADFVLFDMEHSGWGAEKIKGLLETARAAGIPPLVRVRDSARICIASTRLPRAVCGQSRGSICTSPASGIVSSIVVCSVASAESQSPLMSLLSWG